MPLGFCAQISMLKQGLDSSPSLKMFIKSASEQQDVQPTVFLHVCSTETPRRPCDHQANPIQIKSYMCRHLCYEYAYSALLGVDVNCGELMMFK